MSPLNFRIPRWFFTPVLYPHLRNRRMIFILLTAAALYVASIRFGLTFWICPFKASTGVNCPGCGLGTAVLLLLQGKWQLALTTHFFSPFFLLALIIFTIIGFLPYHSRDRTVQWILVVEKKTGISAFVLTGLILYWVARLLLIL